MRKLFDVYLIKKYAFKVEIDEKLKKLGRDLQREKLRTI